MTRSLDEIRMADPHTHDEWREIIGTLVAPQRRRAINTCTGR